jgi:dTDP-4-amino-4,6-dideoxygalactose transaminase
MNNLKYLYKTLNIFGYNAGNGVERLKECFSKIYGDRDYYVFKNGRTGIYVFLKSLNLPKESKVLVQAFTCNAVITPILNNGFIPKYVDIEGFNMSYDDLLQKYDSSCKVLILQHTFGIKADSRIIQFCKEKSIFVIEDCAHTLGNSEIGFEGDASMFSFGIEKLLPTRVGGILMLNNKSIKLAMDGQSAKVEKMGTIENFQWLVNPISWRIGRRSKIVKRILKKLGLIIGGFTADELKGNESRFLPKGLSSVLANIAADCLADLEPIINSRKEIAKIYIDNLDQKYEAAYIRYPYVAKDIVEKEKIQNFLISIGVPVGSDWFSPVIFPEGTDLNAMGYCNGECKNAENTSNMIINLPTSDWVTKEKALEICNGIKGL